VLDEAGKCLAEQVGVKRRQCEQHDLLACEQLSVFTDAARVFHLHQCCRRNLVTTLIVMKRLLAAVCIGTFVM